MKQNIVSEVRRESQKCGLRLFLCLKGSDKLLTFFKDAGLDGKAGWQLFKEKEYLGKLDNQKEVEKLLEQYILRFERDPKEEPELSRFHLFDAKGNIYQRSVTF